MHITCVICSDLFTPSAPIYSTQCGHIFHYTCILPWFENSKTCPQCRTKTSSKSLVRLFFNNGNVSNKPALEGDVTILQHKLDNMEYTMKLRDAEIKTLAQKNQEVNEKNKALREKIKELEQSEKRYESVSAAYKEQIKFFKAKSQNCSALEKETIRLKRELKDVEQIKTVLAGSRQQVNEIIQNENSVESLALLAATLKKSLVDTDRKKKELHYELKKVQNEFSQFRRKMTQVECEYEDTKRQLTIVKGNYEKEVQFLKDKFAQLQSKTSTNLVNESLNNSIRRIVAESPVNYNRTPVLSGKNEDVIDLDGNTPSQSKVQENIAPITIDDSPLPASSLGMFAMKRPKIHVKNTDPNKFSIFKTNQPVATEKSKMNKSLDYSYDGLGGSSKEDVFPTPGGVKRPKSVKVKSSKFKKLSADAGKPNRKMSEFINLT